MKEKQWVQHISGQGEKWELQKYQDPEWPSWVAPHTEKGGGLLYLPKSEYRLCDPPEVWKDVTGECESLRLGDDITHNGRVIQKLYGYRLRKVQLFGPSTNGGEVQWAFIVEQKVTQ